VVNSNVEMDAMVVTHQVLGLIGPKPVLPLDICTDQTTDVKITSSHHVDFTATQPSLLPQLVLTNVEVDITLHIPLI